jgi:CubicO group peptidase (beta-lactamase class C family)
MNEYAVQRSLEFLSSWLEFQIRQDDLPGVSVAIYHKDQLIFEQAFGHSDVEAGILLQPSHLFNVGSQAKMFTAVGVLQLVSQGQVQLDDPIVKYLPWIREHRDSRLLLVTVRQLLWHGAGLLREGFSADFWQLQEDFPDEPALRRKVLEADLVFSQGQKIKYSNLGYALLGQIIEGVSGLSYADYMRQHIVEPLNLSSTHLEYSNAIAEQIASGYTRRYNRQRLQVPKEVPTKAFLPVSGWYMTAADMARFIATQFEGNDSLLSDGIKQLLHRNQRHHWMPLEQQGSDYALGFANLTFNMRQVTGHGGSFIGTRTAAYFDPVEKLAVVVMANAKDAPIMLITEGIFGVFDYFTKHAAVPTPPERAKFNTRLMNLWQTIEIVATHQRIVSIFPDDWLPFDFVLEELEPTDDPNTLLVTHTLDMLSEAEKVQYTYDADGKVTQARYTGATTLPEPAYKDWLQQFKNLAL